MKEPAVSIHLSDEYGTFQVPGTSGKQVPFTGRSRPGSETPFFTQQWGDVSGCFKNETAPYPQVKEVCKVEVCMETFG